MQKGILFVFLFAQALVYGQVTKLSGTVKSSSGSAIEGVSISFLGQLVFTDERGSYAIEIPKNKTTKIYFNRVGFLSDSLILSPTADILERNIYLKPTNNVLAEVEVVDQQRRTDGGIKLKPRELEFNAGPLSTVEGLIKTMPGVVSRSELSSQYNVRGGSFDENLVYVNGIEVYRPFLARSGQQEGLSFVNSDMVQDIYFSAGGFAARYGDKMSSVLDINYRQPEPFGVRAQASLLGVSVTAEGRALKDKLGIIGSFRYRNNQVLLGTTDLTANYKPRFTDVQTLITYQITDELHLEFLGNYAKNNFRVVPESSQTNFGTLNEALQLNVFFEGQEQYFYTTAFGATKAVWSPQRNIKLDFIASAYQTVEEELTDVIGYYRLAELNNNLGSDDFGEISVVRGVGGYQSYLRNRLDAIVLNLEHKGLATTDYGTFRWGARIQHDDIVDRYKEFEFIDSAGYSVRHNPSQIDSVFNDTTIFYTPATGLVIWEHYDSRASVISNRLMGYIDYERSWKKDSSEIRLLAGVRSQYWTYNQQLMLSPRAAISYTPGKHQNTTWRISGGYYYQPPFYREFRDISGTLNPNIRAQLAIHAVAGLDYAFTKWKKPFKMVTEVYYKGMRDLIPYEVNNVRVRYSAVNDAVGYAAGVDLRINGEFVKGTESWASLSLFRVMEDLLNDESGYIPRPTDNRFSFAIFFQDYLPQNPSFRVSLNLYVTGGFPFGAPGSPRDQQIFRAPAYRRVDIGFIKILKQEDVEAKWDVLNNFRSVWIGLEVFNLLQTRNTASYLWVRDISSQGQYAVPNYLTARLLNLKLTLKI